MDEGPGRNTPYGAFVCSAGARSAGDLDTGAHRGPVIEPLGLVHWHVDAPVRARIAERRAPGGAVEAVAAMEVLHPRHIRVVVMLLVPFGVRGLIGHVLLLVPQVDLVGAGDRLVAGLAVDHRPRAPHRGVTDVGGDRLGAEVHVDPLLARGLGRRGLVLPVGVLLAVGILAISVLAVGVLSVLGVVGILLLGSLDLFHRGLDRAALEGGLEGTGALQGVDQLIGDRIGIGDLHAVALLGHDLDDLALVIDLLDAVLGLDGVLLGTGGDPLAHTLLIDRDRQGLAALVRADRQPAAAALGRHVVDLAVGAGGRHGQVGAGRGVGDARLGLQGGYGW